MLSELANLLARCSRLGNPTQIEQNGIFSLLFLLLLRHKAQWQLREELFCVCVSLQRTAEPPMPESSKYGFSFAKCSREISVVLDVVPLILPTVEIRNKQAWAMLSCETNKLWGWTQNHISSQLKLQERGEMIVSCLTRRWFIHGAILQ